MDDDDDDVFLSFFSSFSVLLKKDYREEQTTRQEKELKKYPITLHSIHHFNNWVYQPKIPRGIEQRTPRRRRYCTTVVQFTNLHMEMASKKGKERKKRNVTLTVLLIFFSFTTNWKSRSSIFAHKFSSCEILSPLVFFCLILLLCFCLSFFQSIFFILHKPKSTAPKTDLRLSWNAGIETKAEEGLTTTQKNAS